MRIGGNPPCPTGTCPWVTQSTSPPPCPWANQPQVFVPNEPQPVPISNTQITRTDTVFEKPTEDIEQVEIESNDESDDSADVNHVIDASDFFD